MTNKNFPVSLLPRLDPLPQPRERRPVVVGDLAFAASGARDAEALPEIRQIQRDRTVLPLRVELAQHRDTRRAIARLEHALARPALRHVAARALDAAQRVVERLLPL